MTERTIEHASFTIERRYEARPSKVFAAWADQTAKSQWFAGPEDWEHQRHDLDVRVGGREVTAGGPKGGPVHTFNAVYWDLVPDERIVYTYEMLMDETRVSVSLTTIDLKPDGARTGLTLTEHGAFFDGLQPAGPREQGTGSLLEALGRWLEPAG